MIHDWELMTSLRIDGRLHENLKCWKCLALADRVEGAPWLRVSPAIIPGTYDFDVQCPDTCDEFEDLYAVLEAMGS